MSSRILVAGIGNIFLGDDGFGCRVVAELASAEAAELPPEVRVVDYGIRGTHLAYDVLGSEDAVDPYDALVLADVLPSAPETGVRVIAVDPAALRSGVGDPHGMDPVAVLSSVRALGGTLPPTYVVGVPAENVEEGIGLSDAVAAAVPVAAATIRGLVRELLAAPVGRN